MTSPAAGTGVLQGLRVVDFGQYLAGPLVGMTLADHGADVIHVSPPGGPMWRTPANAALFRNKRAIELDLKSDAGRGEAARLVASADVVIENFRPGVMARLGLDPVALTAADPRLIWCSIPGFAADDPRAAMPGWDGLVGSAVGIYPAPLFGKGDPWFTAMPLASTFAAFMAAHRIAGALISRMKTGRGQTIEMSLYDAAFQALGFAPEMPTSKPTTMSRGPQFEHLCRMRRASDGTWLFFDAPLRGLQRLIDHYLPGYDLLRLNLETAEKLGRELDALIATRPGAEWERIGQEDFLGAFGLAQPVDHWLRDRHALDSETLIEVDDPELGATIQPGYPVTMSRSRPGLRWARGAAEAKPGEAIDWLGPRLELPTLADDGTGLALHGLRVVDCASLLAGPTTARVLAQYGAEIIKIDKPSLGSGETDPLSDDNAAFFGARSCSSGKRMVYLDLQHPEGREVMQALVRGADILHHNFTAEAAERLGLAPAQVAEINPALIISTISLHARGGYRETYRGHDPVAQLVTGMGHRMGGDGQPALFTIYLNDNIAGHVHAFGVMMALLHRHRTGEGQMVNCSLSQVATMHQLPFMIGHEGRTGDEPAGLTARGWHALHRLYRARDGWFFLADESPRARAALAACALLPGVETAPDADLEAWLESAFARHAAAACVDALQAAGLAAHRFVTLQEIVTDPAAAARGMIEVVEHPGIGRALGIGHPLFVAPGGRARGSLAARRPGLDTIAVLREHGFADRIVPLIESRVVATGEMSLLNTTTMRGWWMRPGLSLPSDGYRLTPEILARIEGTA